MNFLLNEENKKELYPFLADKLRSVIDGLILVCKGTSCVSNDDGDANTEATIAESTCSLEEADTRLFEHPMNAVKSDFMLSSWLMIRT
jgi:hypothetical protein